MCLSLTAIRTLYLAKDTDCYIAFLFLPTRTSYHPSRILWSARRRQAGYESLGPATVYHRGTTEPSRSRHEKPYNRRKKRPAVLHKEHHDESDVQPRSRKINQATLGRVVRDLGAYQDSFQPSVSLKVLLCCDIAGRVSQTDDDALYNEDHLV
jgi:hypothetical protein